jgi:hypothetical protein
MTQELGESESWQRATGNGYFELEVARLRSHERHMRYIYGLRFGGLVVAAATIICGAFMVFYGLEGSFNWAIEAPNSIGAKLTNASPGIEFATSGMLITLLVIMQRPVSYRTGNVSDEVGKAAQHAVLVDGALDYHSALRGASWALRNRESREDANKSEAD